LTFPILVTSIRIATLGTSLHEANICQTITPVLVFLLCTATLPPPNRWLTTDTNETFDITNLQPIHARKPAQHQVTGTDFKVATALTRRSNEASSRSNRPRPYRVLVTDGLTIFRPDGVDLIVAFLPASA
jgi:hypothetical protein